MQPSDTASSPEVPQRTLKNAIHCSGSGRQSGQQIAMTLRPAPPDLGIVFSRVDLSHRPWIPASWEHARSEASGTKLINETGVEVSGIGPLMSALGGCAIDNVMIELDGPEVPAMDGSAAPFVFLIECAGRAKQTAPRRAVEIRSAVEIQAAGGKLALAPAPRLSLDLACEAPSQAVGRQDWQVTVDRQTYKREISRARRFDFLDPADIDGEAEAGRDDAVTVIGDHFADERPLRFSNEFVRQEAQSLLGDLYLAGAPIIGQARLRGRLTPQGPTAMRLLEALFADAGAWAWRDLSRAEQSAPAEAAEAAEAAPKVAAGGA